MNTFEEITDMLQAYFECEKSAQATELSNSLCNKCSGWQVSQSNLTLFAFSLKCLNYYLHIKHFYFFITFTLTRHIDKFKLLSIFSDKSKKICSLFRIPKMTCLTMFYTMLKIEFLFVVDVSRNINFRL
jgi:hypothetical protein